MSNIIERCKERAALKALDFVKDGQVLGIGTGSTVAYFIKHLGKRVKDEELHVLAIPTSYQSMNLLIKYGIPITTLHEYPEPDLSIDGADEVDKKLNVIKGGGAAHAREKVIDSAAKEFIVVVDYTKISQRLGEKKPVPVEVLPYAVKPVSKNLHKLGAIEITLRSGEPAKDGPVITDNGNLILDARFPPIERPKELEFRIKVIPGVVEVGIFAGIVNRVIVGYPNYTKILKSTD